MFIVLLGYFKVKFVVLNFGFYQIKYDLKYVYEMVLLGFGFRLFNFLQKENERIYKWIFEFCEYQCWSFKVYGFVLVVYLMQQVKVWFVLRYFFDVVIEYLLGQKIVIFVYSIL